MVISGFSSRKVRAIALGTLALLLIGIAGLVYTNPAPLRLETTAALSDPRLSASRFDALHYTFVSPNLGWALDERTDGQNLPGDVSIFITSNGGRSWHEQMHGKLSRSAYINIQFFDVQHGIVVAGIPAVMFRTTDGKHWTRVTLPGRGTVAVTFTDADHGWLADSLELDRGHRLYATADGGDTWFSLPDPPTDAGLLAVRSPAELWMAGHGDSPQVYLSSDGGHFWDSRVLPSAPPARCSSRTCVAPACSASVALLPITGVVAVGGCGFRGVQQAYATALPQTQVVSIDRGNTWTPFRTPLHDSVTIWQISYLDQLDWWAMARNSLWKTSDAGQTWVLVSTQKDGWNYSPHVLDALHAWAELSDGSGSSGLATTSDGGMIWTRVSVPHPASQIG